MQENIENTTGARVSVAEEGSEGSGNYISLGDTLLAQQNGVDVTDDLNEDGFLIKRVGRNIYIKAENVYGVLNGVNYFLEKYYGVEYLTKDYTKYGDVALLLVKNVQNETRVPDFFMREYYARQSMQDAEYAAKLGYESTYKYDATYNGEEVIIGGLHNLPDILPRADYPDFYAEGTSDGSTKYRLDLTNGLTFSHKSIGSYKYSYTCTYDASDTESMISVLIEKVKAAIQAKPNGKYVILGMDDSGFIPDSNKNTDVEKSVGGYTGLYMFVVNTVAEQVHAWMVEQGIDRDIRFVATAYWTTIKYAECDVTLSEYVDIWLPTMFCQYHAITDTTCSDCVSAKATFEGWKAKLTGANSEIWIYNYATNFTHSLFWFNNFSALQTNIAYYKNAGVNRILYQGHPHAYNYYQGNLENYILSRLFWDSSLSVEELVKAYNQSYYADSATVVNTVYDNMNSYGADTLHLSMYNSESTFASAYSLDNLNTNLALIEQEIARVNALTSLSAAEKTVRVNRLLEVEVQLRYMVLVNYETYYGNTDGRTEYATDLCASLKILNIEYIGESRSVASLKETYGVTE